MCGSAALVHALDSVRRWTVEKSFKQAMEREKPGFHSLGGMAEVVREMTVLVPMHHKSRLQLQKLKVGEKKTFKRKH